LFEYNDKGIPMKYLRYVSFLMGMIVISSSLKCQNSDNPYKGRPFKDRITIGGDIGLSVGNQITYIRLAPMLGYLVSPKLTIGAGPSYQYYEDSNPPTFKSTIYGGAAFAQYFVFDGVFLQAQPEILNLEEIDFTPSDNIGRDRITIPVLLLGGGYSQRSANGSGFFIALLYDVVGDLNSPYPNDLVFRVGGFIGL
jgi:hypothetical protein